MIDIVNLKIGFIIALIILSYVDFKTLEIDNVTILPAIALGCFITGNWQWAGAMFLIGAGLFGFSWDCPKCGFQERHVHKFSIHRGGDVKLFAMMGAFMGPWALPTCFVGYGLLFAYRKLNNVFFQGLPVTPFMCAASVLFIWFV